MKKILISHALSPKRMQQINQVIPADCLSSDKEVYEEVLDRIQDYEALLAIGMSKVDKKLMDQAKNLKIISKFGVGYDDIDIEYAKSKGIIVANTPNSTTGPTADLAIALLLSLTLRIPVTDRAIRNKQLNQWNNSQLPSNSPTGKTLGIIGMGRIGKAVAKRALPFGMKIVYFQRNPLSESEAALYNAQYLPFEQLLKEADIISLHTPLTKETHHLIDKAAFQLMQPSALLINTARGSVIDEQALIEVLQKKQIAGAALDVFDKEPHIPNAFLALDNVILAPHIGTGTKEARQAMLQESLGNLIAYFRKEEIKNRVV
jgi:glyoxylate reductase